MRLIDADALIEELNELEVEMMHARLAHIATQVIVDEAPTIDAVPVVRCKDCKWWDECDELDYYGYCHHGERKDDE